MIGLGPYLEVLSFKNILTAVKTTCSFVYCTNKDEYTVAAQVPDRSGVGGQQRRCLFSPTGRSRFLLQDVLPPQKNLTWEAAAFYLSTNWQLTQSFPPALLHSAPHSPLHEEPDFRSVTACKPTINYQEWITGSSLLLALSCSTTHCRSTHTHTLHTALFFKGATLLLKHGSNTILVNYLIT